MGGLSSAELPCVNISALSFDTQCEGSFDKSRKDLQDKGPVISESETGRVHRDSCYID